MIARYLRLSLGLRVGFVLFAAIILFLHTAQGNSTVLRFQKHEVNDIKKDASDSTSRSIDLLPIFVTTGKTIQISNEVGKTAQIGRDIMTQNASRSIADVLAENSLLHIKSLGQGAQATSSFRGTSSSHTQVLWNGININSATLGNFDFSLIPSFFVDDLTIYSGTAQMRGGSSIGGSVQLNNKWNPLPYEGHQVMLRAEWGSWSTQTYGLGWRYKHKKWSSHTRFYLQDSENDFRYENRVLSMNPFEENRKQAAYNQKGVLQEVYYPINATDLVSIRFWGQWDTRQLPQPITSFNTWDESQESYHLRTLVKYALERKQWKSIMSFSYMHDQLDYTKLTFNNFGNSYAHNQSNAFILSWDNAYTYSPKWEMAWSVQYRMDRVKSDSYAGKYAQRSDLQGQMNVTWTPISRVRVDVSGLLEAMQSSNKGTQAVPNVSAVLRYELMRDLCQIHYGASRNHRFPTLNDWYWVPGGNPNLKPERALSQEVGLSVNPFLNGSSMKRALQWKTELKFYAMDVQDWIMWVPTGSGYLWEPRNFGRVRAMGAEWMGQVRYSAEAIEHQLTLHYAYSSSVDRTQNHSASYNRQLPYIPLNKWNLRYAADGTIRASWLKRAGLSRWNMAYGIYFTDARYTSADESYFTPAYQLHDLVLGTNWKGPDVRIPYEVKFQLKMNNLWDAYYESTQYYPMPTRNISFSISVIFG